MICAKIGGECPHKVFPDPNYAFVLMPFKNSESIFASIKRAVEEMKAKSFICDRADKRYASSDIWCKKICRSIRRAKYLIIDATGANANVFYELGFAHALGHTKNIIITQNIKKMPFDVSGFSVIKYTEKNLPELERELQSALRDLDDEITHEIEAEQSPADMIKELIANLRGEEKRSDKYKEEARESEKQEDKLKKRIKELEAIVKNPEEETKKIISEKKVDIVRLEKELSQIDQEKKEKIKLLQEQLEEEQKRHKELQNEFRKFKRTRDAKKLSQKASLTKKKSWQTQVLNEGMDLRNKGQLEEAIAIFTELIEKDHSYSRAYYQRAFCFRDLGFFEIALADLNRALELNPKDKKAYSNRGLVYRRLMDFEHAINDLDKALKLDPNDITILMNKAEILIIAGKAIEAEKTTREALTKAELIEHQAVGHYLLAISLKLQRKSTKKVNAELERLLNLNFQTAWTFTETEIWLKKEAISKEIKNYIQEKTKMLKKHRKRSRKSSGK